MIPGEEQPTARSVVGTRRRRSYVASLGAGYIYIGVSALTQLLLIPVLVDGLGTRDYGIWLTLYAAGQWVSLSTTWISPAVVQKVGEQLANDDLPGAAATSHAAAAGYGLVGLAVLAIAAAVLPVERAGFLGGEVTTGTRMAVLLAGLWMAFTIGFQSRINLLNAAQRLYIVNFVQAAVLAASAIAAGVMVTNGAGIEAVSGAYAGGAVAGFVALTVAARRSVPLPSISPWWQPSLLRQLVRASVPYALSAIGWALLSADLLLLAFLTNPTTVAEYGIAYLVITALLQIIWRVADTTQPYVVELDAKKDTHGLRVLHKRVVTVSVVLGAGAAAFLATLGRPALAVWVGETRVVDETVLWVLAGYLVLQTWLHASFIFPFSAVRMKTIGVLQIAEGAVKVVLAVVLIAWLDEIGVAIANGVAVAAFTVWYIPRFTFKWLEIEGTRFLIDVGARAALVGVVTGLAAWVMREAMTIDSVVTLILAGAVAMVAFLAAAALVGLRSLRATP